MIHLIKNFKLFFFCLSFITIQTFCMEMPVAVEQSDHFDALPVEVTCHILEYLYVPHKNPGTKQIIRFFRSAKKFYYSQELSGHIMHMLQGIKPVDPKQDKFYKEVDILFEIGTPAALQVFKDTLNSTRDKWKVDLLFGHLLASDEKRKVCLLQSLGADLNSNFQGIDGRSVFIELAGQYYPDSNNIEKFIAAGANINSVDAYGSNILIHIIRSVEEQKALPVVRLLIQKGINLNHLTVAGRSAAAIAQINDKYLIQAEIEYAGGKNIS